MAVQWRRRCGDCDAAFTYSDWYHRETALLGIAQPERCQACEAEFLRERRTIARIDADVVAPPICRFEDAAALPAEAFSTPGLMESRPEERAKFGVTDAELQRFFELLDRDDTQVILVEAPTGAGKSTFFPWRLLSPPEGVKDPEVFTRHGQIVVTQPRIRATEEIPDYVRQLHGCLIGARLEVGFRHSQRPPCVDWQTRLAYVTDGTLINWIARGELAYVSLIMLDEAHERSLNIDLIIGMLAGRLALYPRLKLVIASATIDRERVLGYFARHLRGGVRCASVVFTGKATTPVRKHFRCGTLRLDAPDGTVTLHAHPEDAQPELPYDPSQLRDLTKALPSTVADQCLTLLKRMVADEAAEPDLSHQGDLSRGDILVFLHGRKAIDEAALLIESQVRAIAHLASQVDVLPLHMALPAEAQRRATGRGTVGRIRVIISTNAAETSLTIDGIKHVVETGIINQEHWDTATESRTVPASIHSQAGCRQRWGRAGRTTDGDAWCLYTKEQFDRFPVETPAAILRSRLEPVILTAQVAGIPSIRPGAFPWLDPPAPEELERAYRRLRQVGALDETDTITARGLELQGFGGDPQTGALLMAGDRFACAAEMATVLGLVNSRGLGGLLLDDKDWDRGIAQHARRMHDALTAGCSDDLELFLKVVDEWQRAASDTLSTVRGSWAWREVWSAVADELVATTTGSERQAADLRAACTEADLEMCLTRCMESVGAWEAFAAQARNRFRKAGQETWARLWFVDHALLEQVAAKRDELLDMLAVRKKEKERRPLNLASIDRLRLLLAWQLPDHVYSQTDETFRGECLYRPLGDEGRPSAGQPQDGGVDAETILNEVSEPELRAAAPMLVRISDRSVCASHNATTEPPVASTIRDGGPPEAFIGFGQRVRKEKPDPRSQDLDYMQVNFVAAIDREWAREVAHTDEMGLALLIQRRCQAAMDAGDESISARVFIEQIHPPFSQFECHLLEPVTPDSWRVRLGAPVSFWPEARAMNGVADDPAVDDRSEDALETDLALPEISAQAIPHIEEDPDDSDDDESTFDEEPEAPPPATVAPLVPPTPRTSHVFDAVLRTLPGAPPLTAGATIVAEVMGYAFAAARPTVVLETPTLEMRFRAFAALDLVGQEVAFQIVGARRKLQGRGMALRVLHPATGMEADVSVADLTCTRTTGALARYTEGQSITLFVEGLDDARCVLWLSAVPVIDRVLRQVIRSSGFPRDLLVQGTVLERQAERVIFEIQSDPFGAGMAAVGCLFTAELYARRGDGCPPVRCQEGSVANLRISVYPEARQKSPAPGTLELRELAMLGDHLAGAVVRYDDRTGQYAFLAASTDNCPAAKLLVAARHLSSPVLRQVLRALARRLAFASARPADPYLEVRFPLASPVRGVLHTLGRAPSDENDRGDAGRLRLASGLEVLVRPRMFPEGHQYRTGQVVSGLVYSSSSAYQKVEAILDTRAEDLEPLLAIGVRAIARDSRLWDSPLNYATLAKFHSGLDRLRERHLRCGHDPEWFCWAVLSVPHDRHGARVRLLLSRREEVEEETCTSVSVQKLAEGAQADHAILLCPSEEARAMAIERVIEVTARDGQQNAHVVASFPEHGKSRSALRGVLGLLEDECAAQASSGPAFGAPPIRGLRAT